MFSGILREIYSREIAPVQEVDNPKKNCKITYGFLNHPGDSAITFYLPQFFMNMVIMHRPADFLAVRGLASLVEVVVSGVIVAMIYKGQQKATA